MQQLFVFVKGKFSIFAQFAFSSTACTIDTRIPFKLMQILYVFMILGEIPTSYYIFILFQMNFGKNI